MQCSFCYGHGHNKMGCPKAMKMATAALPQWKEWQKMDHEIKYHGNSLWRAKQHFSWPYQTTEALEIWQKKQARSKRTKVCNFCGHSGHNKRTCSALKETKAKLKLAELGFRKALVYGLQKTGQGIGAVVSGEREYWNRAKSEWVKEQSVGLIVGHRWELMTFCDTRDHGELEINASVGKSIIHVRWSNGDTEYLSSFAQWSVNDKPILYRNWQVSKLVLISKSEILNPPASYLDADSICQSDILKGRKAQNAGRLQWIIDEKVEPFIEIGQKLSSTIS